MDAEARPEPGGRGPWVPPWYVAALLPWSLLGVAWVTDWADRGRLERDGVQARAVVLGTRPAHGGAVEFLFHVGRVAHEGAGPAGSHGLPPVSAVRVGDSITVTYLPDNPRVSTSGVPPRGEAASRVRGAAVVLLGASLYAAVAAARQRRRRERGP
ncbi:MAG TPA: hypothetical protein VKA84_27900 [Gemmatimonadaceae bacterium]|nr:hypothetical protein [Gemmatimonadaceae bacterium]